METWTVDTVALLSYLADALPARADALFKKAENGELVLVLPSIVVGEALYTMYKGKEVFGKVLPLDKIATFLDALRTSGVFQMVDMDIECWETFTDLSIPELHDRMIVATSLRVGATGIITTDPEMHGVVKVAWA